MNQIKSVTKYFQRIERTSWVLIGGALGIALGILLELINDTGTAVSIIAGISLTIVVTQLGEIIHKNQIGEVLGVFCTVT